MAFTTWRLLEEFSWSRSDGASIASINYVVYALAAPIVGLTFDRLGPRLLMPLGAALVGLGLMLSSISNSLLDLYFSYGIVTALGQGALGFVGHNALISFWFVKRRATAIGIASMGQGVGALVMVPATQILIDSVGWRWTYIVTGSLMLLLLVPANALLQRPQATRRGAISRRRPRGDGGTSRAPIREGDRRARLDAARGRAFLSILVHYHWSFSARHCALHDQYSCDRSLRSVGYEKLAASFYFGLIGFIALAPPILWGSISDRLGRSETYGLAILVTVIGVVGMIVMTLDAPLWSVYSR